MNKFQSYFHHYLLVLFFPLLSLHAKPEVTRIELYYGIAQGNYLIGDLEGASRGVEQMFKLDPDYTPAITLNARILLDLRKPERALNAVERAIKIEPDNLEHQLLKALVLGNLNRQEEAIRVVERVLQSAPAKSRHHRVASKLFGLFLMAEGNLDKAAQVFNQSYLNNPEAAQGNLALAGEAYLQKAKEALAQSDFKTALEAIDRALELHKQPSDDVNFQQHSQLNILRARVLTQAGRINEAIATLQTVTTQQPENPEALITLASLYASTEQWDLLQNILPGIAAKPELQDIALYLEGRAALANERVGTAREAFEAALRLLPDGESRLRTSLEFYQGMCLLKVNRTKEGDRKIIQSLDNGFRPETQTEAILASRTLLRDQQAHRAITYLEAITLNQLTNSIEAWNLLGRAHLANDSEALALSAFNQSLSIQPQQSDVIALRGSLLRKMGDLEGAATDIENALALDPENPALTYSLGLIYLQLANLSGAKRLIGKSAKQLPKNPGLHLLHALLAYNMETHQEARLALESYLSQVPEQTNESALYLEYILIAQENPNLAIDTLSQRIETSGASPLLGNFLEYARGTLDRKTVLDAAGYAESPEIAQKQLCEATYWLAQHERIHNRAEKVQELLKLAIQIGSPDYPEYQFAQWQLITYF